MEPEVRAFLVAIVQSVSMLLLWMLFNTYFGIKMGLFYPENGPGVWHFVFYIFSFVAFLWVIRYIIRKWKNLPKMEQ